MIRGLFRLVGLLLLAVAFVFLIYDGARSIADQALRLTPLGEVLNDIHQSSQQACGPWWRKRRRGCGATSSRYPQPAGFCGGGVLGLVLLLIFRPRKPLIGYARN